MTQEIILSFEEFKNLETIPFNRHSGKQDGNDLKNHYSVKQMNKGAARVKKYKKVFKERREWNECCPAMIHELKGKLYLTDGQGRREALIEVNNEEVSKNGTLLINEIPCRVKKAENEEIIFKDIIAMNTNSVNWTAEDVQRADAVFNCDDVKLKYLDLSNTISKELGTSSYVGRLIAFGEYGSQRDKVIDCGISPYCEDMKKGFKYIFDSQKWREEDNAKAYKKIKNNEPAIALYSYFGRALSISEEGKESKNIIKAAKKLANALNKINSMEFSAIFSSRASVIKSEIIKRLRKTSYRDPFICAIIEELENGLNGRRAV